MKNVINIIYLVNRFPQGWEDNNLVGEVSSKSDDFVQEEEVTGLKIHEDIEYLINIQLLSFMIPGSYI